MPGYDVWYKPLDGDAEGFAEAWGEDVFPDWLPEELRGFNVVRLSQSMITTWQNCPSQAVAEKRPTYGHAAAVGIVAHAIMEARVTHQGRFPEHDESYAAEAIAEIEAHGWRTPDKAAFLAEAYAKAEVLTQVYLDNYHHLTLSGSTETEVSASLVWDVRDRAGDVDFVVVTGTADLIVAPFGRRIGVDYKSGGKMPEPWMVRRYGVQWRIYAAMFELDEMFFHYPLALNPLNGNKGDWVANKYDGVVHCTARPEERELFKEQIIAEAHPIAEALLRSTDPEDHVLGPTNWHCSAKWCQRFARHECIGAHTEITWVRESHETAAKDPMAIYVPEIHNQTDTGGQS